MDDTESQTGRRLGRFILQIRWGVELEPNRAFTYPLGFGNDRSKQSQIMATPAVLAIILYSNVTGTDSVRNIQTHPESWADENVYVRIDDTHR